MEYLQPALQIIAALGLLNVWILRYKKQTAYRGGSALTLPEEFQAYALPSWFMMVIGGLKMACALAFLVGLWIPVLVAPAAGVLVLLMLGAIAMHLKVRDPLSKSVPALAMLILAVLIAVL